MTHQHRIKQHRIELANHRVGLSQCVDSDFVAGLRTHLPRLPDCMMSFFPNSAINRSSIKRRWILEFVRISSVLMMKRETDVTVDGTTKVGIDFVCRHAPYQ
jgi:hypothetical protein